MSPTSPTSSFEIVDPSYENIKFDKNSFYNELSVDVEEPHSLESKRTSLVSSDSGSVERRVKKKWKSTMTSKFKRSLSLSGEILSSPSRNSLSLEKSKSTFYFCDINDQPESSISPEIHQENIDKSSLTLTITSSNTPPSSK